jgi:IPT/TIG domain-containing protein
MRLSFIVPVLVALVLLAPQMMSAQAPTPRLVSVDPVTGKAGDVISVTGENLEKTVVVELYLTDGKNDLKVPIGEQNSTTIKFTVPASTKAGRYSLMVLTAGKEPKLIEQPVKVTIE